MCCVQTWCSATIRHSSRQKWLEQWKYYFDSPLPTKVVSYVELYLSRRPVWGKEVRIRGSKIGCDPCETSIKAKKYGVCCWSDEAIHFLFFLTNPIAAVEVAILFNPTGERAFFGVFFFFYLEDWICGILKCWILQNESFPNFPF